MVDRSTAAALRRALISGNIADTQQLVAAHAARHQLSTQEALAQLLGHRVVDDQLYQRYRTLLAQHVVDVSPQRRWCPAPGCGRSLQLLATPQQQQQQQQCTAAHRLTQRRKQQPQQGAAAAAAAAAAGRGDEQLAMLQQALQAGRGVDVECDCGCRFCWLCQEPAHEPATCKQVTAWRAALAAIAAASESRSEDWIGLHTKRCPGCRVRVQKHGGCNHMTCKVCRREWCWCKASLRWSAVRGFYLGSAAAQRQLEQLTSRLATPVEQLLAVIQQLPAALSRSATVSDSQCWRWSTAVQGPLA
ncbi:hypothetical protein OEZ85_004669 [Tetradesmus obliquus]|uniref:RBR-type E3 ubiquitin transferase n=1 Tax=Tetradesmus obliquus TaxID=3088 RepID=A0ABY8ULY0_TETOB|nr:hypothetical protein OEZ85_004669 [Tetradesmus obliquus]